MSNLVPRHHRILMFLAGFFGFVITTTLSVLPGSGVADVIRAGTAAAANSAGNRIPAAQAVHTDRETTLDGRPAAGPPSGVAHRGELRYAAASPESVHDSAYPVLPAAHAVVQPAEYGATPAGPGITAERAAARPASAHLTAVQVRGPPSSTGS